jgi:hypothetical protein
LETNPRRIVSPGRFGIVVGIALLLSGLGFGILAAGGALRGVDAGFHFFGKRTPENVAARFRRFSSCASTPGLRG